MADISAETRMNLASIRRVDPYAKDLLDTSAHVAFYTFNPDETEWEKTDVEGAFFVYTRNAEPFHSVFINNRLNTNSLVEPITANIELQSQPPFLLYRNERSRIRGFWFYNRSECERIGELIERIIKDDGNTASGNSTTKPIRRFNSNIDIFSMLSKAQQDFNDSLVEPAYKQGKSNTNNGTIVGNGNNGSVDRQQTSRSMSGATSVPIPIPADGTSQSVMNFFASAKPAKAQEVPFFQRMLSAPVHVDQIEKKHRGLTPHDDKISPPHQQQPQPNQPPFPNHQNSQASQANVPTTYAKAASNLENGFGFMRIQSPSQQIQQFPQQPNIDPVTGEFVDARQPKQLKELLMKPAAVAGGPPTNATNNTNPLLGKPALMLPTMFKPSSSVCNNFLNANNTTAAAVAAASSASGNMSSSSNTSNSNSGNCNISANKSNANKELESQKKSKTHSEEKPIVQAPEPLTQTQLLQAMSYLIKNDPDFVRKIHEAYLKSFTEMVSL